jgi:hypothetical protein
LHGKAHAASLIANQPEAADDADKSHKAGTGLSRNRLPRKRISNRFLRDA